MYIAYNNLHSFVISDVSLESKSNVIYTSLFENLFQSFIDAFHAEKSQASSKRSLHTVYPFLAWKWSFGIIFLYLFYSSYWFSIFKRVY